MPKMMLSDEEADLILKRRASEFQKIKKFGECKWCDKIIRINFNNSILTYKYCPVCGKPLKGEKL